MRKIPTFFWEYRGTQPIDVDLRTYRLEIKGNIKNPQILSLEDLESRLPICEVERRIYCVNGWSLKAKWRGYKLIDIINMVQPETDAQFLCCRSVGGYEDTTSVDELLTGDAMLVTHMNDDPLSVKRGKPMRLLTFDMYIFKAVKAIQTLEFVDEYKIGTWAKVGYDDHTIQPYPHLSIDEDVDLMPEQHLIDKALAAGNQVVDSRKKANKKSKEA